MTHKSLYPIRMKMERCADEIILRWPIHRLPILLYQRNRHKTTLRNLVPHALYIIISHWKEQHKKQPARPWKCFRPWKRLFYILQQSLFCSLLHLFLVGCKEVREKHFTDHSILSQKKKATIFHSGFVLTSTTAGSTSNKAVRYKAICTTDSPVT